jgi:sugar/nucleoside kinase (ribokinase family)
MSLLVVGSIALDSVKTPFGERDDALGGSAVFFSSAASILHPVQLVGVVGDDYPESALEQLAQRGADLRGVEHAAGKSFRWKGEYSYDLQNRDTLDTQLGVFASFDPRIPEEFRDARYVFLGNIDPELQLRVLDQIREPALVACDTMNYWIHGKRDTLLELLQRIDVLLVNDAEARELSGDWNVYRAARWIVDAGPSMVVVKQGAYGAVLYESERLFYIPAFPLEDVFDPTGAGDAFAGGFMAHLARTDDVSSDNLRRAMVYGSAMGSFAVERFSIDRFNEIGPAEVTARVREFAELVRFDIEPESGQLSAAPLAGKEEA